MTQVVDARSIPLSERAEFIVETARQILLLDIAFGDGDPALRGAITGLGALRITRFTSNGVEADRTEGEPVAISRPASCSDCR